MRAIPALTRRTGLKSAVIGLAVRALPLAYYTPVSKWLAFSLVTVEHLEQQSF